MYQTRNVYLRSEGKAEPFLLSEVVQRYSGDENVSSGGRSETGAIPVFHRWQE